jgi:hypothetical protein
VNDRGRVRTAPVERGPRKTRSAAARLLRFPELPLALVAAFAALAVSRFVDAGWFPSIALASLLGVSVLLWATDASKSWGDLAQGIMVSVVVAIALIAVQKDLDDRARRLEQGRERRDQIREESRQRAAEEQSFRLALGQQRDLRGIDLRGRNLRGFFLARKNLSEANLNLADLSDASLVAANLREIEAVGTQFDRANLTCADLRSGSFSDADPTTGTPATSRASFQDTMLLSADLRNGLFAEVNFRDADLTGADLRGGVFRHADFTGADLEQADLSGRTSQTRRRLIPHACSVLFTPARPVGLETSIRPTRI